MRRLVALKCQSRNRERCRLLALNGRGDTHQIRRLFISAGGREQRGRDDEGEQDRRTHSLRGNLFQARTKGRSQLAVAARNKALRKAG